MGKSWCNGDCEWKDDQCKLLGSDLSTEITSTQDATEPPATTASKESTGDTACGGHFADTCADCPIKDGNDMGESWCNGDCEWKDEQCKLLGTDPQNVPTVSPVVLTEAPVVTTKPPVTDTTPEPTMTPDSQQPLDETESAASSIHLKIISTFFAFTIALGLF